MKRLASILMVCLLGLFTSAVANTRDSDPTEEGSFKSPSSHTKKIRKEYRFAKKTGKLSLDLGNVKVNGYRGDEVIISVMVEDEGIDERAAGLQGISGSGFVDNTRIGLHVSHSEDVSTVRLVAPPSDDSILVNVPEHLMLSINNKNPMVAEGAIHITNMKGEIEVSNMLGDVKLENVQGPMTIKTINGNIEAVFDKSVSGPISILTTLGFIDVALPAKTKANLQMSTTLGNLYAAEDLNVEATSQNADKGKEVKIAQSGKMNDQKNRGSAPLVDLDSMEAMINLQMKDVQKTINKSLENLHQNMSFEYKVGNRVDGKINGGGENIILRTTNGNIYLRATR